MDPSQVASAAAGETQTNNCCIASTNLLGHPDQLSVSGAESELNIQFTQFNLTPERQTENSPQKVHRSGRGALL